MPALFNRLGISFQYPENWTLDDSDALLGRRSVTLYSPGGAFWTVTIHSGTGDPAKLTAAVVKTMSKEYAGLETDETQETVLGHKLVGYDLAFSYLDLTNTATVRGLQVDGITYTIFCQADDQEYAKVQRVFQAMTVSLISGMKNEGAKIDD
jgi:hypothetical protein